MHRPESRRVAAIGAALQHRMADKGGWQIVAREEPRLERQQAEQLIPQTVIVPHPASRHAQTCGAT